MLKYNNKNLITVIALLFVVTVCNSIGKAGFFSDGMIYATLGKHISLYGSPLAPYFSDIAFERFFEHPPFLFIYIASVFKVLGISWVSAKLSAYFISALIIVSFFYHLKDRSLAFFSSAVLLLTLPFLKKSQFPNLDLPLILFSFHCMFFYFYAQETNLWKNWLLSGFFFGLALLSKGPPALFLVIAIGMHILMTKNFSLLKNSRLYFAFLTGLLVFSLWPILLYFSGHFDGFKQWVDIQIIETIFRGRGNTELKPFEYVLYLLKYCAPWILLAFWTLKEKKNSFNYLLLSWFLAILVPFSFVKLKFSHYLLPLYPPLAILAGKKLNSLSEKPKDLAFKMITFLSAAGLIFIIIFPQNKITRDKVIIQTHARLIEMSENNPKVWGVIDNKYPFYDFTATVKFLTNDKIRRFGLIHLKQMIEGSYTFDYGKKDYILLLEKETFQELKAQHEDIEKRLKIIKDNDEKFISVLYR